MSDRDWFPVMYTREMTPPQWRGLVAKLDRRKWQAFIAAVYDAIEGHHDRDSVSVRIDFLIRPDEWSPS